MSRDKSLGHGPSAHDSSGAPGRGDKRRPLSPSRPIPPVGPAKPVKGFGKTAAAVISALVLTVVALAVYVALAEKQEPVPPSNQPSEVSSSG